MKKILTAGAILALVIGVVHADDETTDPLADLEKSESSFQETWVHPEADFSRFNEIYLWEATWQYRDVGPARRTRSTVMNSRKQEFGILDSDREAFEQIVGDVFDDELAKGKNYTITEEIGPNTLIIRGGMLDIISRVPPELVGRNEIYVATIGEATLIIEAIDPVTGNVQAVVAERRTITPMGGGGINEFSMPTSSVTITGDVKRWARRLAGKLRKELEGSLAQ